MNKLDIKNQLDLLRKLEWSAKGRSYDTSPETAMCPTCHSYKPNHYSDCNLSSQIRALQKALEHD